ncbi:MAG: hypothetical protein QOI08_1309, partial [Actinomycetota bacterium]|nr:hypothetical protein [Actinomycetota bacterium]
MLEAGGSEVQAIAVLLHDAAEDCGGEPRLEDIRDGFGDKVGDIAELVRTASSRTALKRPPWKERKKPTPLSGSVLTEPALGDRVDDREDAVRAVVVAFLEVVAGCGHGVGDMRDAHDISMA